MNLQQYPSALLSKWLHNHNKHHPIQSFQTIQLLFPITREQLDVPVRNTGCLRQNNCIWPMKYLIDEVKHSLDYQLGKVECSSEQFGNLDYLGLYVCRMCVQSCKLMAERKFTDFYHDKTLDWTIKKAKQQYLQYFSQTDAFCEIKVQRHFKYSKLILYGSGGVRVEFSRSLKRNDNMTTLIIQQDPVFMPLSTVMPSLDQQLKIARQLCLPTPQNKYIAQDNIVVQTQPYAIRVVEKQLGEVEIYVFLPNDYSITTYTLAIPQIVQAPTINQLKILKLKHKLILYSQEFISILQFKPTAHNSQNQQFFECKHLVSVSANLEPLTAAVGNFRLFACSTHPQHIYLLAKVDTIATKTLYTLQILQDSVSDGGSRLLLWKDQQQIDITQQIITYFNEQQDIYLICLNEQSNKIKVMRMILAVEPPIVQPVMQFAIWIDSSAIQLFPIRQQFFVYILVDMAAKMLPLRLNLQEKTVKGLKISEMNHFIKEIYQRKNAKQKSYCFTACTIYQQTTHTLLQHQQSLKIISGCGGNWKTTNIHIGSVQHKS